MADDLKNTKVISKKDPGFPEYLNFDKLRSEGIAYLGKLSGQIWTDHNVHDPGITILEMLCYALLDLGYRTNLPEADIFTGNPEDKTKDNNFFTPAQILACNPLTITDYRKLLVDIAGVRNAWLEPATDVTDICRPSRQRPDYSADNEEDDSCQCEEFLNGLYHVCLDLENTPEGKDPQAFEDETIERVKKALMAHRNLCEDFQDIYVLCRLPLGVCADIELEENAEADKTYLTIVEELRNFFTPSPRFYTLQQLLDKQKPMEDIFAGRPHNITQSHGFVDTEEFEKLRLKKEIHLSDVYNIIFGVPGVRSVHKLALRLCDNNSPSLADWKFPIKKNHIPEFSVRCSGFRFSRNSMPLSIDFKKYEGLFDLNFSHHGKVLYHSPSPYLDREIPKGIYRNDLAEYYSIQNEFPRVYGIEEGGLPDDAPALRKAQALQLKSYLLFFDQLLANYLTQLKNIRSLFALSSPKDERDQHTYFINQLNSVPELQKLLRFQASEAEGQQGVGAEGSTLVFPVDKNKLLSLKENDELKYLVLEKMEPYRFTSLAAQDMVISQLKNDLYHEAYTCEFVTKTDDCVYYYLLTSSEEMALISKKYFNDISKARENAASVKYIGTFDENYRSFPASPRHFSFTMELNLASFGEYLQLLVEDRNLYVQRRQEFLHHLLARFAEKFTDYALLSFGTLSNEQTEAANIQATEQFLTRYDDISSNRGKAYDYLGDQWNNHNISGFEKRVKAISGMEDWKRHSLCNFEVDQYEEQYAVTLKIANQEFFTLKEKYDTRAEAQQAAQSLLSTLSDRHAYRTQYVPHQQAYAITLHQNDYAIATFRTNYATDAEAHIAIHHLHRTFSGNPATAEDIFISQYIYFLQLLDHQGRVVRTSAKSYDNLAYAQAASNQLTKGINDPKRWQAEEDQGRQPGTLYRDPQNIDLPQFIDLDAFKLDINNTIVGKPDQFTYDVLDINNHFKFRPVREFDDEQQAREHWQNLLTWMSHAEHYRIQPSTETGKFTLHIVVDDEDQASCSADFNSEQEALQMQHEIYSTVRQHLYTLVTQEVPHRWRFTYDLGSDPADHYALESVEEYHSKEDALSAATAFSQVVSHLQLRKYKNELRLVPLKTDEKISSVRLIQSAETNELSDVRTSIRQGLSLQKAVNQLLKSSRPEDLASSVDVDPISKQGLFVYRLVDKDTIPASYSKSFADRLSAEDAKKALSRIKCGDYRYLEICLGGDIIRKRKDESTRTTWYHYLVKSRHHIDPAGQELILFESTKGYPNAEDAQKAFTEHYLQILAWASDAANYEKVISTEDTEENLLHTTDPCIKSESIVFIPRETMNTLGGYNAASVRALVALAKTYPIRLVAYSSDAFYALFPCEEKPEKPKKKECKEAGQKYVYYFRLQGTGSADEPDEPPYWQSTKYYTTPEEARQDFYFFLMLLCYPGNFFVDCDYCDEDNVNSYRIYLREVLAESTGRFVNEEEAWGKEGVQKFICVSQSRKAFHLYQRKEDCCYTYYVACADNLIYHPCQYDTPQQRDEMIDRLYKEINNQYKNKAYQVIQEEEKEGYVLFNERGEPFASVIVRDQDYFCDALLGFLEKVAQKQVHYVRNENGVMYAQDDAIVVHAHAGYEAEPWKKTLEAFACYFPVVRKRHKKKDQYKYCIEIKLPGFNTCQEDMEEEKPCGCYEKEESTVPACYVAWKSRCCFDTCEEAYSILHRLMPLLLRYENYRPLFDCACYHFGIALHEDTPYPINREQRFTLNAHEMVALNPQCYTNPEMVCKAVERSWKLINSEGLHMVEHILLRPRCPEDCACDQYSARCEDQTHCCFTWTAPDDDPCADQPDICFVPGADPYSFIATIVLPAWPLRFRKSENRALLENILYREAPAHVLLRVLWLAPHDFCCFESNYKSWGRWLAQKKNCREEFSVCNFLEFLFTRNYECLEDCDICLPCQEDAPQPDPCFEGRGEKQAEEAHQYLNQINELYCWRKQYCDAYEFIPCEEEPVVEDNDDMILFSSQTAPPRVMEEQTYKKEGAASEKEANHAQTSGDQEATAPAEAPPAIRLKPKPLWVNSRLTKYRKAVDQVLETSGDHPVAGKTEVFLKDPQPSAERTANLLAEMIQHEQTKTLTKKQVFELLQSSLCYYLDKVCFEGKDLEKISALRSTFEELRNAKTDMPAIYHHWNPEEVKRYEPDVDLDTIRQLLTGIDKP